MEINITTQSSNGGDRWMITYASLLTAVLAFFILIVTMKSNEAKSTFKISDDLTLDMFEKINLEKNEHRLHWLDVENTGFLGIRIIIPSIVDGRSMFQSNSGEIADNFIPYINSLSMIIRDLELNKLQQINGNIIEHLRKQNKILRLEILVQGHTDILPVHSGKFTSNWDLSTARSYSFMKLLKENTGLPPNIFSIAGYGPFIPKRDLENYSENRRVEVYIKFQLESTYEHTEI